MTMMMTVISIMTMTMIILIGESFSTFSGIFILGSRFSSLEVFVCDNINHINGVGVDAAADMLVLVLVLVLRC